MGLIKEITRHKFDGKEFETLTEVQSYIENVLGEKVIDGMSDNCGHLPSGQRIKMLEFLTLPETRNTLLKYLDIKYVIKGQTVMQDEHKNILDYNVKRK